jgi:hypothetical protein
MNKLTVISTVFIILVTLIVGIAVTSNISNTSKFIKTKATITDYNGSTSSKGNELYQYYYKYKVNGKEYINTLPYRLRVAVKPNIGSTVNIKYNPNNPNYFILDNSSPSIVVILILIFIGSIMAAVIFSRGGYRFASIFAGIAVISFSLAAYTMVAYGSNIFNPVDLLIKQPFMIIVYAFIGIGVYILFNCVKRYLEGV